MKESMNNNPHIKNLIILVVLSYFFFMFGNSLLSLTGPDEVFYTQTAKEMAQQKTWMTPILFGQPQFEKPVLTYWLLRIGFFFFGVTSFGARFFPAFFAMLGVLAVYWLGFVGFRDEKKAFISSLVLMSGGLYIGLARTVFTDMIFSVLILFSLASFFWGYVREKRKTEGMLFFFIFSGLAVLAKGPLGLLIPFLAVVFFLLHEKNMRFILCCEFFFGFLLFLLIALPWYVVMIKKYGASFNHEFFYNDHWRRIVEAEHSANDTWYFYPISVLGCLFPWSLYVIVSLFNLPGRFKGNTASLYCFLASWVLSVFFVFQPAHSKLVSYIFPAFGAFALMTGDSIGQALTVPKNNRAFPFASFGTMVILLLVPVALMGTAAKFSKYIPSKTPIYILIAVSFLLFFLMLFFTIRREYLKNLITLSFVLPLLFLTVVSTARKNFEPYVSSKDTCAYLVKNYDVQGTILCSRFYVRGVRYYTDKSVAVIDIPGKQFFSPHPIPFLDTKQKVRDFLKSQPVTFCILKKSLATDIKRIVGSVFKSEILKVFGDEYLVKIERL